MVEQLSFKTYNLSLKLLYSYFIMKIKNMMKMQCAVYVVCMHGKLEMTRGHVQWGLHVLIYCNHNILFVTNWDCNDKYKKMNKKNTITINLKKNNTKYFIICCTRIILMTDI